MICILICRVVARLHVYFYLFVYLSIYLSVCLSIYLSILSYPILSYPILSYPILSYPILSYPILSYPILSYPIYLSIYLSLPITGQSLWSPEVLAISWLQVVFLFVTPQNKFPQNFWMLYLYHYISLAYPSCSDIGDWGKKTPWTIVRFHRVLIFYLRLSVVPQTYLDCWLLHPQKIGGNDPIWSICFSNY